MRIDNRRWDGKENWLPQSEEEMAIRNLLRDVVADRVTIADAVGRITKFWGRGSRKRGRKNG